jgi:nickel-dependent lactate racemase
MSQIELGYGRGHISFTFDEGRFETLRADEEAPGLPLTDAEIGAAIDDPLDSQPLENIISPGESVLIVVSDATRATASAQVVNILVRRLIQLGVAPSDLRIIFATGIHRPVTLEEKRELLTPFIVQRIKTLDHDAHDAAQHILLGETGRDTPIEVNRALVEHSHVILMGAVGFHYFAGFTGGRKSICPGLASARTIAATHMLALDLQSGGRRKGVGAGLLDGNYVHEECERIAAEIAPSFIVNTLMDASGRAVGIHTGNWRSAHRWACIEYASTHTARIAARRPLVVVSAGGTPSDINLIQAHKALEMAAHAATEGGDIILVAECAEGLGRDDFLKWFDAGEARGLAERLRVSYEVNGQTAWTLLDKAERFRIQLVSRLPDEDVRRMRLTPAPTLEDALARVETKDASGFVMPHGASVMPVVAA